MTKSKICAALASIALSFGVIETASALSITAGDIKFTIDNYDAGTTGYGNSNGTKCTTIADCDAVSGKTQAPGSIGSEDTWGIFSVALITNISTGQNLFTKGGADGYLIGMFYGLDDFLVDVSGCATIGCTTTALSLNGKVELYNSPTDYDPSGGATARTSSNTYPSIPASPLYLSADFVAGVNAVNQTATYQNTFANNTFAGAGQGFLNVTGGSAQAIFDTNSLTTAIGTKADLFLDVTFNDVNGAASSIGWTVTSAGQVKGAAVPEPGTLALVGLGLVGAGFLRRRKS